MAHAILLAHAEDSRKRAALRIRKRQLRACSAPMHLPEEEFILNFRLSKSTFKELVEEYVIDAYMPSTRRSTAVRNDLKICDSELNILHVDASYGGASHDSFVWNQSPVKSFLERLESIGEGCWLLGDSGYAQCPWMMTPILGAASESPAEFYTYQHCRVRNTVERMI
ncbi:putative nuclease HARBI1 [Hyposmocoma kahamanoa]|uniref:putative nuclease HARBI1 n=1 Tax=Hyposmocoma kahamanoa TaxID=1477025 RepID=UPI000E6D77E0|nr:putative nuclease HARBI1 [Hyposmocoma kahamanoa]